MKRPVLLLPYMQIEDDIAYKWAGARPVINAICTQRMEFTMVDRDRIDFTLTKVWDQLGTCAPEQVRRELLTRIRIASLVLEDVMEELEEEVLRQTVNQRLVSPQLIGTLNAVFQQWTSDRSFRDGQPTINAILMHEFGIQESLLGPFRNRRAPLRLRPTPPPGVF